MLLRNAIVAARSDRFDIRCPHTEHRCKYLSVRPVVMARQLVMTKIKQHWYPKKSPTPSRVGRGKRLANPAPTACLGHLTALLD
jgi:hypothetical protein